MLNPKICCGKSEISVGLRRAIEENVAGLDGIRCAYRLREGNPARDLGTVEVRVCNRLQHIHEPEAMPIGGLVCIHSVRECEQFP